MVYIRWTGFVCGIMQNPILTGRCWDSIDDCADKILNSASFCSDNDFGIAETYCRHTCGFCRSAKDPGLRKCFYNTQDKKAISLSKANVFCFLILNINFTQKTWRLTQFPNLLNTKWKYLFGITFTISYILFSWYYIAKIRKIRYIPYYIIKLWLPINTLRLSFYPRVWYFSINSHVFNATWGSGYKGLCYQIVIQRWRDGNVHV